jgi:hypothetical protein
MRAVRQHRCCTHASVQVYFAVLRLGSRAANAAKTRPQAAHPRVMALSSMWVVQSMLQGQLLSQHAFKIPHIRSSVGSDMFYGKQQAGK